MKRTVLWLFLVVVTSAAFAQQLPTVAVATFEPVGGVSNDEANVVTELFMAELVNAGAVKVADRANFDKILAEMKFQLSDWSNDQKTVQLGRALNAGYVIRGQLMKMGNIIYWTATMIDINTAQVLFSAREQMNDMGEIFGKLPGFTAQMLDKIPMPNYFVGKWYSVEREAGTELILEFRADGRVNIISYGILYVNGRTGEKRIKRVSGVGIYSFDRSGVTILLSFSEKVIYYDVGTRVVYTIGPNISVENEGYSFNPQKTGFILDGKGKGMLQAGNSGSYTVFAKMQ
jgi:TolB-like protein